MPIPKDMSALNEFRQIAFLLYKLAKPDQYDTMNELLMRVQVLLEIQESKRDDCCDSPIRIPNTPPLMPLTPPCELDARPPTPPTLVIHPDHEVPPNVVVTKEPDQTKEINVAHEPANIVVTVPSIASLAFAPFSTGPAAVIVTTTEEEEDADSEDQAILADLHEEEEAEEEEAEVEEVEEEAEEAEVEEEEEAEEEEPVDVEEDYDVEKIGKRRYFVGQTTRKVYERIDAETIGEYLGVLREGKIVPN